ncbi:MAG: PAS domain S-box protein, partial [Desulfobacterales bacterium]|nr:PAS domain S-box protein [Desulfobacterales bacterium]
MKFQKKLTLITLLTVLLPLIAAMIVLLWFSRERVRILSLELAEKHVQIGSEKLSGYFSQRISEILTYANLPLVQTLDWQTIGPFLSSEIKRHNDTYEKLLLGLPSSQYFVTSGGNPAKGGFARYNDSNPSARLKSIAKRKYWQFLVSQNNPPAQKTYVSDPIISYTTGVRQVIIGATILSNNDNRVLGMIGGSIQWEQIEQLFNDMRKQALKGFGHEATLCLVSQNGNYIYHPDLQKVIHVKLDSFDNLVLNDFGEKVTIRKKITEEKSFELAAAGKMMVQGNKGYAFYTAPDTGQEMVIIYAPVSSSKYSMALIIPEKTIMAPVKNLFWVLAVIALISIIIAIVASLIMSRKLTTSIKDLSMVAKNLTKGNLNTRLNPKGSDEISELTSIFNEMAHSLQNRENELKKSEKKYRSLFEESRDAIVITTKDGRFVDINQYTLDLFGYTREEMMELQVTNIYENPDDRLKFQTEVKKKGSVKDYAVKFRKKDGTPMDCLLTITLRSSGGDGTLGYHGIIRDITAQKAVERQLIQSQKMESIGTLSGGIAHDFNNILFSIIGNTEMILQDLPKHSEIGSNVQEIFIAANRAKTLVQQILTFSRQSKIESRPTRIQ